MGIIIKAQDLPALEWSGLSQPVIYCCSDQVLEERAVPINIEMAKKLSSIKANRRTLRMEWCFQQVIAALPDDVILKDFDVMFNPCYAVDVLRIMCSVARTKPFSVLWPGRCEDDRLVYAEEGYRDYKTFEIGKYNVTVVV